MLLRTDDKEYAETTHCKLSSGTLKASPTRGSDIDADVDEEVYINGVDEAG